VVEEGKEESAATTMIIELPANIEPEEKDEVTPEVIVKPEKTKEEKEVIEKIVEEKPSAPTEKTTTSEVVEVKKDAEEKPPTQS
jgi:hypothetical protein